MAQLTAKFYLILTVTYGVAVTVMLLQLAWHLRGVGNLVTALRLTQALSPGEQVPEFFSFTADGDPVCVRFGDGEKRKLLCILRTNCPYSRKTIPYWQLLASEISRKGFDVLGVVTNGQEAARVFSQQYALKFPLTFFPDYLHQRAFKVSQVPQTLVIDPYGKVLFSLTGELDKRSMDTILAYFQ